jgi:hypothetical protein
MTLSKKSIYLFPDILKYSMFFRLFIILILSSMANLVVGQNTHPPYRQYTMRDGLPQMQIWSMFQDSRGYMWIGTKGGLSRFNGEKFTNFNEKDGLADNLIEVIREDYSGKIWVVTQKGLSMMDGQTITTYPIPHFNLQIEPTPDGKIWVIGTDTSSKTFFGYFENGTFTSLIEKYPELLPVTFVDIKYLESKKSLIISTGHKIFELNEGKMNLLKVVPGEMRMATVDSTIVFHEWDTANNITIYELHQGNITEVAQISDGQLDGKNLSRYHHEIINGIKRSQIFILAPDTFEIKDFSGQYLNVCLIDQDQHLWVGAEEGAIQNFSGGFETYKREFLPMIWSIVEDHQQNIWFASLNFGLMKYDGKTIVNYPAKSLAKYGSYFYFQAQADQNGVVYFPNNFGIVYFDGQSFGSIPNHLCYASYYDDTRKLLFGGFIGWVEVYDLNHRLVRKIDKHNGLPIKRAVAAFDKDHHGNIWMGGATGLARYNWETDKFIPYGRNYGKQPSEGVISIYTVPDGTTWFGGTHGLLWYDEKNDSIRKIESDEISEIVNMVSSIDSTWLVFSQPTGIYLMDLKKFRQEKKVVLTLFNERNGFGGLEPGQNGAMKDSKGNIWMTTGTEVVKLNPKELDFKKNKINVRISGFNGKAIPFNQDLLVLPNNDRSTVIQFETICFNRPKAAQFSWRIDESSGEWSAWQEENYAVLTNLIDGKSVLQVRSRIPGLPDSETIASISLLVNIAIWKQEWFFPTMLGLVSLLVLLSLVLLLQGRTKMVQINRQAKMFQLQAILSQMNPHFIFNVMASLQSMILSANIEKANEYLVKMSNLVRGFLEASVSTSNSKSKDLKQSETCLQNALDVVHNYTQFQQLIYPDKFDYEIYVDPEIDPIHQTLPPMLIQPFVENAIRHGLLQKAGKGFLKISITLTENNFLNIEIADNGIGIKKASEMMHRSNLLYTSRGKELTLNRIKLLNEMGYNIRFDTLSSDQGTKVTITIAYDEK